MRICVSLTEETTAGVVERMEALAGVADLFEVRADYVIDLDLLTILRARVKPLMLTCRSESEGGRWADDDSRRRLALLEGVKRGFDYVDIEHRSGLLDVMREKAGRGLVVSYHDMQGMPRDLDTLYADGGDAAFPHGTTQPKPLRQGDVVLIDGGGRLFGYSSDITRTGVFGAPPTDRQRRIWDAVRRAQQAAFEAARPGAEAQAVDAAARRVIEQAGFGPGYRYFTHRVGHGIGMDGHEWPYLVMGNKTLLRPGMCFSDEPGIYIGGQLGVRHEDIIFITETGAENMTRWSGSPEEPAVV